VTDTAETPRYLGRDDVNDIESILADDARDFGSVFHATAARGDALFTWDYTRTRDGLGKLYEKAKSSQWNGSTDLDWSIEVDPEKVAREMSGAVTFFQDRMAQVDGSPVKSWGEKEWLQFQLEAFNWRMSQFLHGEQGALLVASQLVSCAPSFNAKLYAASQTFDEARHVEVFNRYLQRKVGFTYPISRSLKLLLDKILTDPRWDLKFIGMQIIIEGLALAAFNTMKQSTQDPVLRDIVHLVIRDEARHVTFGVNYLEEFVQTLTQEQREERAQFAFEACLVMRTRLIPTDVYRQFGWPVEEATTIATGGEHRQRFRNMIFARVVPNLKRIGLLTDAIRPKFEELGLLEFETLPDDGHIDWDELSKPLYDKSA